MESRSRALTREKPSVLPGACPRMSGVDRNTSRGKLAVFERNRAHTGQRERRQLFGFVHPPEPRRFLRTRALAFPPNKAATPTVQVCGYTCRTLASPESSLTCRIHMRRGCLDCILLASPATTQNLKNGGAAQSDRLEGIEPTVTQPRRIARTDT